jgi:hypothetical protein
MIASDIAHHRLYNQRIAQTKFEQPGQVVAWFGAMQGQDYASVKWAVGLRCCSATEAIIEQAIANKTIVRTWLMRGTLHLAAASDVRWMLALLGPRIIASSARRYRQLNLDAATFAHSDKILTKTLQDGRPVTRAGILLALQEAGISTAGQRGYHILGRAGLKGLICFGPIQGKQETFVLLDQWLPPGKNLERGEALAELARRYFRSHGPATLPDFVWWSGLPVADARSGLERARARLHQEKIKEQVYWLPQNQPASTISSPTVYLLPAFDEYFLGYKDRTAVLDPKYNKQAVSSNGIFRPVMVLDGQVVGIWKRTLKKREALIKLAPFNSLTAAENEAFLRAANQYGAFLGLPVSNDER